MATGLGSFASGLAGGLVTGNQMASQWEKDKRENEKWALEKPQRELDADMATRRAAATKQAQEGYTNWLKTSTIDPDGNPLPAEKQPDEWERKMQFNNFTTRALLDNQAVDPDQFMKLAQYGAALEKEGLSKAMQTYLRTGDQEKALKVWNSQGTKAPEGTTLRRFKGEDGSLDVEIVGPDGRTLGTFGEAMFYLSADNVAKNYGEMQKVRYQEKEATKRTGISAGASLAAARMRNEGDLAVAKLRGENELAVAEKRIQADRENARKTGGVTEKDQYTAFNGTFDTIFSGLTRNMTNPNDAGKYTDLYTRAKSMAMQAWTDPASPVYGRPEAAIQAAVNRVLRDNGMLKK